MRRCIAIACLLLVSVASAQHESSLRERGSLVGLNLPGSGPPVTKVYIVQLRSPSAVEQHVARFAPTLSKLSATPTSAVVPFNKNSAEVQSYTQKLVAEQDSALARVGPGTEKIHSYRFTMNGFAARMTEVQASKMQSLPEVLRVWEDEIRPLPTKDSPKFLGLFKNDVGLRGALGLAGEDVVIGVIDSGIVPGHPSLDDSRQVGPQICRSSWADATFLGAWLCREYKNQPREVLFEPLEDWDGDCQPGEGWTEEDCNNKLIGARWFSDGAAASGPIEPGEFFSPRDVDGHGTHVATTAGGNKVEASAFGTLLGTIEGIAPRARIAAYKACWVRPGNSRSNCNTSDLTLAIDSAVADGVDIINYSIGNTQLDIISPDDVALMNAAKAGVLTVVAAGNDGPDFRTIGSPALAAWVITAAASSRDGDHSKEAMQVTFPLGISGRYAVKEAAFTPPLNDVSPLEGELILVDDGDDTLDDGGDGTFIDACEPLINDGEVSGNIAFIERGGCEFAVKIENAENAGATGVIVFNIAGDPIVMTRMGTTNTVGVPAVMVGQADGNLIKDEIDDGRRVEVVLDKSFFLTVEDTGNVMGGFSSRGPGVIQDVLKPDLTAPGIDILAGYTPDAVNSNAGENFAFLTGTSMSTPHIVGVGALLKEEHPDWTPSMIKSALMTTAYQEVAQQDGETFANPFDFGAGHIDANLAVDPGLVYDTTDDEYDALACGIESPAVDEARCDDLAAAGFSFEASDMNLPSIAVSRLINERTVTRRVINVSDTSGTYAAQIENPPGVTVDVVPNSLSLAPGQSATFDVTVRFQSGPLDLWRFGSLSWVDDDHTVHSPIAIRPASIIAPAEANGFGGSGSASFPVTFGYTGTYTPRVHGLNLPFILRDNFVDQDPDKLFVPVEGPGVTSHSYIVPEDQAYLRFALFDALTDGDDDLDLYLYYCPEDTNCSRIAESGGPTSQEEINVLLPGAGTYVAFVHGFATDNVTGGQGAIYDIVAWQFGLNEDQGNMTVTAPSLVTSGSTVDVQVDWFNLLSGTIYLGGISHTTPEGLAGITIISIQN